MNQNTAVITGVLVATVPSRAALVGLRYLFVGLMFVACAKSQNIPAGLYESKDFSLRYPSEKWAEESATSTSLTLIDKRFPPFKARGGIIWVPYSARLEFRRDLKGLEPREAARKMRLEFMDNYVKQYHLANLTCEKGLYDVDQDNGSAYGAAYCSTPPTAGPAAGNVVAPGKQQLKVSVRWYPHGYMVLFSSTPETFGAENRGRDLLGDVKVLTSR